VLISAAHPKYKTRQVAGELLGQGGLQACRYPGGWLMGGEGVKEMQM